MTTENVVDIADFRKTFQQVMQEAKGETADFACSTCDTRWDEVGMALYLEFGEPDCPKCKSRMKMVGARKAALK